MTLKEIVALALQEDLGEGDHTSLATIPADATGKAGLLIKEEGVLAGVEVAREVFRQVDHDLEFTVFIGDGQKVKPGDVAFTVSGCSISILSGERLALNFMQRMSGIATATRQMTEQLKGLHTRLLDTRKTTPLLRALEKYAVKAGGGFNHRFGLYDMILIKDNHVDFAGGIKQAIEATHRYLNDKKLDLKIEIEVRNFAELDQVLETGGVDRILIDNFSVEELRTAVKRIGGRFRTEASGGITIDTVRAYAGTGVDFISVGALTHHIMSLDMSLKAVNNH
jgi:nicotinate-nucleotide pyrophosphorylase (carboxylating)